jgi:hypothetical protein
MILQSGILKNKFSLPFFLDDPAARLSVFLKINIPQPVMGPCFPLGRKSK